jgi:hypothetical protein
VRFEHALRNDPLSKNPAFGLPFIGDAKSIRAFRMPLHKADASTRAMLVGTTARPLNVRVHLARPLIRAALGASGESPVSRSPLRLLEQGAACAARPAR